MSAMSHFIPEKIVVHHSLTRDSGTVSWGAIRRYHMESLNFEDIGYHAGCELVVSGNQEVHYETLFGRTWDEEGAHCRLYNSTTLGFCFVGNYDLTPAHTAMIQSGAKLLALWIRLFELSVHDIVPHNYFNSLKSCPGKQFDMDFLRTWVRRMM